MEEFYRHRTILTEIPGFDLVREIPHEYLHHVCLGVVKKLLGIFQWLLKEKNDTGEKKDGMKKKKKVVANKKKTQTGKEKKDKKKTKTGKEKKDKKKTQTGKEKKVDERICLANAYRPREFQRGPAALDELPHYKGTQFRGMLLYYGPYIFNNIIERQYMKHFFLLSVAIRALVCNNVPLDEEEKAIYVETVATHVYRFLRKFVMDSIDLYGPEFVVHNVHCLIHAAEDFRRFGPLDVFSAFHFESFLGRLKKYIKTGCQPMT